MTRMEFADRDQGARFAAAPGEPGGSPSPGRSWSGRRRCRLRRGAGDPQVALRGVTLPGDQRLQHVPARFAEDVVEHRRQLDLGVVEQPFGALLLPGPLLDQGCAGSGTGPAVPAARAAVRTKAAAFPARPAWPASHQIPAARRSQQGQQGGIACSTATVQDPGDGSQRSDSKTGSGTKRVRRRRATTPIFTPGGRPHQDIRDSKGRSRAQGGQLPGRRRGLGRSVMLAIPHRGPRCTWMP